MFYLYITIQLRHIAEPCSVFLAIAILYLIIHNFPCNSKMKVRTVRYNSQLQGKKNFEIKSNNYFLNVLFCAKKKNSSEFWKKKDLWEINCFCRLHVANSEFTCIFWIVRNKVRTVRYKHAIARKSQHCEIKRCNYLFFFILF